MLYNIKNIVIIYIYMSQSEATHIYYNARINAELESRKQATFSVSRVQPILSKPNDYELAVIRFSLPSTSIPLFVRWNNRLFK